MFKVGLIGCGWITRSHRDAYAELRKRGEEIEIAACCDIRTELTESFKGKARIYGDYTELLQAEAGKLDFVDICLPTFLHAPAAIAAMDLGYNVLCEKPMAISAEAAQEMCDAAKRNNRLLMIAHSKRFRPVFDVVKAYVEEKKLGEVKYAHFTNEGGTPDWSWEGWHFDEKRSGGVLLDLVHDADLIQHFFGMPKTVSCAAHKNWPGSGYDRGTITYLYDNDVYVTSDLDWTSQSFKYGNNSKIIVFENGYLVYGWYGGREVFLAVDKDGKETALPLDNTSSYYREIRYYLDCLRDGKSVDFCPPEESRNDVRMVMAEYRSADNGGMPVEI